MAINNFSRMMDALRDSDRLAENGEQLNRLVGENRVHASVGRNKSRSRADTGHMNNINPRRIRHRSLEHYRLLDW